MFLQLSKFKKFASRSVFGELQLTQISLNFKTTCYNLKIRGLGAKLYVAFLLFNFKRNYDILNSTSPYILLNKNINFLKIERNRKWKSRIMVLERRTWCFNSKLKVKLWIVGACEKRGPFFVPFILSKGNFSNICVLSECIVYLIHFRNIHTFTYQKTLLYTLFCLLLKSSEAVSVSVIPSFFSVFSWLIHFILFYLIMR